MAPASKSTRHCAYAVWPMRGFASLLHGCASFLCVVRHESDFTSAFRYSYSSNVKFLTTVLNVPKDMILGLIGLQQVDLIAIVGKAVQLYLDL
jgi:hypothetical protein